MQANLSKEFKGIIDLTSGKDLKGLHHHYHLPERFIKHHLGARPLERRGEYDRILALCLEA